jgi:hypothetical protein
MSIAEASPTADMTGMRHAMRRKSSENQGIALT